MSSGLEWRGVLLVQEGGKRQCWSLADVFVVLNGEFSEEKRPKKKKKKKKKKKLAL